MNLYGVSQVTKKKNYYMDYKVYAFMQGPNTSTSLPSLKDGKENY